MLNRTFAQKQWGYGKSARAIARPCGSLLVVNGAVIVLRSSARPSPALAASRDGPRLSITYKRFPAPNKSVLRCQNDNDFFGIIDESTSAPAIGGNGSGTSEYVAEANLRAGCSVQ